MMDICWGRPQGCKENSSTTSYSVSSSKSIYETSRLYSSIHPRTDQRHCLRGMPRGFSEPGKVLKLKKSCCGLKQSLEASNFYNPSPDTDPCLFVTTKVICVVYVDDTLLWGVRSEWIDEAVQQLQREEWL
jgi:hypothetical protein